MQTFLSRILCFLFCLLLCIQPFSAAPEEGPVGSLEEEIKTFLITQGLDASNFSMSYYNPVSGESYSYNADVYLPVGRLRFLPTHMYFYEEETKGTFQPQGEEDPEYTIGGMTLEECRYHSIFLGEESVSEKMQAQIGNTGQYLELINQRYGLQQPETLPKAYWEGKSLSMTFLMNCIQTVSSRPELFTGMMSNYSMVQKSDAFACGSVSYPIVQIRGEEEGYVTAIAEVSAPQNFLLAASVKTSSGGDQILGKLNETICSYVLASMGEEYEDSPETTIPNDAPKYYVGEERMAVDGTLNRWLLLSFAIAGGLALIGIVVWLVWRSRHRHY